MDSKMLHHVALYVWDRNALELITTIIFHKLWGQIVSPNMFRIIWFDENWPNDSIVNFRNLRGSISLVVSVLFIQIMDAELMNYLS